MTARRYNAYRSLVSELADWRAADILDPSAHDQLPDPAEGLLPARGGAEAEEPLARASTTVLAMLAVDDLDEPNASWLLDSLLACGPRAKVAEPIGDAA